jgi:hypothetical protein
LLAVTQEVLNPYSTVLLRQGQYLKDGELAKLQHYSRKEVRTLHQTTDQLALLASYVS